MTAFFSSSIRTWQQSWQQFSTYYENIRDSNTAQRIEMVVSTFLAESNRASTELCGRVSSCTIDSLYNAVTDWKNAGKKVVNDLLNFAKIGLTTGDFLALLLRGQLVPDMSCFTFNQQRRNRFWDLAARVTAFSLVLVCGVSAYNAAKSVRSLGPVLFNTLYFGPSFSRAFKSVAHTLSAYVLTTVSVELGLLASDLIELANRLEWVDNPFDDSGMTISQDLSALEASNLVRQQLKSYVATAYGTPEVTQKQKQDFVTCGAWEGKVRALLPYGTNWYNYRSTDPDVLKGNAEVMQTIKERTKDHFRITDNTEATEEQVNQYIQKGHWARLVSSHITPNQVWYNTLTRTPEKLKSNPTILRAIKTLIAVQKTMQIDTVNDREVDRFIKQNLFTEHGEITFKDNVGVHPEARSAFTALQSTFISSFAASGWRGNLDFLARVLDNIEPHIRLLGKKNESFLQILRPNMIESDLNHLDKTLKSAIEELPKAFSVTALAQKNIQKFMGLSTRIIKKITDTLSVGNTDAALIWGTEAAVACIRIQPNFVSSLRKTAQQLTITSVTKLTYHTNPFYLGTDQDKNKFKKRVNQMVITLATAKCAWAILDGVLSCFAGTCTSPSPSSWTALGIQSAMVIVGGHMLHMADDERRRARLANTESTTGKVLDILDNGAANLEALAKRVGDATTHVIYRYSQRRVGCPADIAQIASIDFRHALYIIGCLLQFMAFMASRIV